jgi:DNA modification methylase
MRSAKLNGASPDGSTSVWQRKPRKPLTEENKPGRYDPRNKINDLTGRDWLLLTRSFWFTEPTVEDKAALKHPAPFLIADVERLIKLFTKRGMTVLDPFAGSGTALVAATNLGRKGIGLDINRAYRKLAIERLTGKRKNSFQYLVGDAARLLSTLRRVDYIVTSPPYHNILRNPSKGTRYRNGKAYRMSARDGISYYTDHPNDLGNLPDYRAFLNALEDIMQKCWLKLRKGRYCSVILSDFTVDKNEMCVQADVVSVMRRVGFEFCGTTVLLQPVKPLFPFGYPFAYKINHHHQNIMTFRKPVRQGRQ